MEETFQALAGWLSLYGYPVLFLVVFAENAGLPVPGETAVLLAGVLAGRPDPPVTIFWVIGVTFCAAVLGDNLGFWLGGVIAYVLGVPLKGILFVVSLTEQKRR